MKLKDIITIANEAYPDGLLRCAVLGDGLAKFIKMELRETYDSKLPSLEQVDGALAAMELAQRELVAVVEALKNKHTALMVHQDSAN